MKLYIIMVLHSFTQLYTLNFILLYIIMFQEFWSPNSPLQSTIIMLIEQIVVAMGEELKVYLPPMVQPVLRVFMQDQSDRKIVTQKVRIHNHVEILKFK